MHHRNVEHARLYDPGVPYVSRLDETYDVAFCSVHGIGLPILVFSGLNHFSFRFRPVRLLSTLRRTGHPAHLKTRYKLVG